MTQPVDGSRGEQPVAGEGLVPLGEVEVAGDEGGGALVALGDEVVQILVGGGPQGFEAEVVDDEHRHAGQLLELSLKVADCAGGVQAGEQLRAGGEEDVVPLTHGAVSERLRQMAFPGAARADDQHRGALVDVAPGREVMDQGAVGRGQAVELEAFERLGGAEGRTAQPGAELLLLAPGDLVLDQQGEEVRVGELGT